VRPNVTRPVASLILTRAVLTAEHIRVELDRLACTLGEAGADDYVSIQDLGLSVMLKGPPLSGLLWCGPASEAIALLEELPADAGPDAVWRQLVG
jgi:hypothetical protein